jgi:hypothetical protein
MAWMYEVFMPNQAVEMLPFFTVFYVTENDK